ncbi:MAG: ATP-binding protein [Bacteroidetes bacterium]|nr:ATP-binding protein [Bacteroidota bacterium]
MKYNKIKGRIYLYAVLIYLLLVQLFGGLLIYLSYQKSNLDSQKQSIEKNRLMTENLISKIYHSQINENLYLHAATQNPEYILRFSAHLSEVLTSIDSLKSSSIKTQEIILDEIKSLLDKKLTILFEIGAQNQSNNYSHTSEKQMITLMMSDYEAATQILNLLSDFHQQTFDFTMEGAQKNELLVYRTYVTSVIVSIIALVLISILIFFIVKNVEKAYKMRIAIEQANKRAREIYEEQHKLLLTISHDIKTPVSSILGYLDLWKHGHDISSKEVTSMERSGTHILNLMRNLLDFSCLNQGLMKVTSVNFNLHELCAETVELFQPLVLQKNLSLDLHLDFDHTLILNSDALKIKQIITNILSNALKYTVEGGVQFKAVYQNGAIHFEINDTGKGIPSEQIENVFEAFVRVEENNFLSSGSGFGLFVTKGMLNLLNGVITVQSTVGKGTRVKIVIPAPKVSVQQLDTSSKCKRLLVIDDDVSFLEMVEKMLSEMGHQADICHTMEMCEKRLQQPQNYDLILVDSDMITFSGKDVLQKVKDKEITLPVFLMSGQSNLNYEEAICAGFNGFIPKLFTMTSLEQLLRGDQYVMINNSTPSLEELFGGDKKIIHKVLRVFIEVTAEHIIILEQAVAENDFVKAQRVCHKILPMFMQIGGADDAVAILIKINESRNKIPAEQLLWKEETTRLIEVAKGLVADIKDSSLCSG